MIKDNGCQIYKATLLTAIFIIVISMFIYLGVKNQHSKHITIEKISVVADPVQNIASTKTDPNEVDKTKLVEEYTKLYEEMLNKVQQNLENVL